MATQDNKITAKDTASEGEKMSEIQALTLRIAELGQSVDRWNTALIWALLFAAIAAVLVVVATRMAVSKAKKLTDAQEELIRMKDKQLALDLKDKDARISEANLGLARLKAPRSLTLAQQERIGEKLKSFSGTRFDTALYSDPETDKFLIQVEDALKSAGWTEIDWKGGDLVYTRKNRPNAGLVSVPGVIIQMHPEHVKEFWGAAETLVSALSSEGISAKAEPGIGPPNDNQNAMHILIGKKPL